MVLLHVKRGTNSLFLYETSVGARVGDVIADVVKIYGLILKIKRLATGKWRRASLDSPNPEFKVVDL